MKLKLKLEKLKRIIGANRDSILDIAALRISRETKVNGILAQENERDLDKVVPTWRRPLV